MAHSTFRKGLGLNNHMPEEDTLSASSRPSKLHSHIHSHTNIYTTYKCNPKTIKREERRMDDGPFVKLATQQETTG